MEDSTNREAGERWSRVRELLEAALDQDAGERAGFLQKACGSDQQLRAEIEGLLRGLDESPSLLKSPVPVTQGTNQDPLLGSTIGAWKLLRRIGDGGTASVYAAARADRQFRKVAAIKVIKSGMDVEEILRRFRNERQILAGLEHPNITRLLDGGSTETGLPYLVMEYVDGLTITEYCATHRLSVTERLELFRTVSSALAYAHQNLIVHRDLKPANILVTPNGVPKVLDFGIAKLLRPEGSTDSVAFTRTQMRMMTPEYASPEQVRGDPITTASDTYSLGVLLYELLTGVRPYRLKTRSSAEVEQAICEWEPERPSLVAARSDRANRAEDTPQKLARRLRGDLDAIVLTALRKEPQRRYLTVDRFSEDIERHLEGLPVSASKDTWTYRAQKFVTRHKLGVITGAAAAVVLVGVTIFSTYLYRQEREEEKLTFQLAEFMLNDLDTAMKSGATSARKTLMDGVVKSLPELASSPTLRHLLFTAYLKSGDIQGNLFTNNLGDAAAAKQSYEQALQFARSPDEIALAELRLADLAVARGDLEGALASSKRAAPILDAAVEKNPRNQEAYPNAVYNWYLTGLTESLMGKLDAALTSYEHEVGLADRQFQFFPNFNNRGAVGLAHHHIGDALQLLGKPDEALVRLGRSLEIYEELRKSKPNSRNLQRLEGNVYLLQAEAYRQLKQWPRAEEMYGKARSITESLLNRDPSNEKYQQDRNSILPRMSEVETILGRSMEARRLAEASLAGTRPLAEKPFPSFLDLYWYCYDLLSTPFPDLHDKKAALHWAQEATELTASSSPIILDLLARAWAENGKLDKAIDTEKKALSLYPKTAVPPGTERAEMVARLSDFESRSGNTVRQ